MLVLFVKVKIVYMINGKCYSVIYNTTPYPIILIESAALQVPLNSTDTIVL